ncbi:uncharacterized protein LOC131958126 isoform X2 [Physella acuta]|uniref:uncharacterized protein LOC131958126 isoform X2 n=1 Tax=Physella acuta TaxID=109671 RepID=UPI0027DBFC8D|nr:uncharacterized protein LOC131958126 isoform X2 [Physella acuta]
MTRGYLSLFRVGFKLGGSTGRAPNFRRWSKSAFLGATWLQPQFPPGENFEVKLKDEEQESLGSLTDLLAKKRARQPGEDANKEETDKVAVINLPGGDKRQPSSGGLKEEVAILELPRIKEKSKAETESSVGLIIAAVVVGFVVFTIAFACYVYSIKKNDGDLDEDVEENKNFNRRRGRRRRRRNPRSESSEDTDEDSLSSD